MSHITDSVEYLSCQYCLGRCYFVAFKTNAGYTVVDVKIFTSTLDGSFFNLVGDVIQSPLYPSVMLGATSNTMTELIFVHAQVSHSIKNSIQLSTFNPNRRLYNVHLIIWGHAHISALFSIL